MCIYRNACVCFNCQHISKLLDPFSLVVTIFSASVSNPRQKYLLFVPGAYIYIYIYNNIYIYGHICQYIAIYGHILQ